MASGGMRITTRVEGLDSFLRKLQGSTIYAKPWHDAMEDSKNMLAGAVTDLTPVDEGALKASLYEAMDPRPVPLYAAVGTTRMRNGFRYPGALHGSPKYHYRTGPHMGMSTKGWMSTPLKMIRTFVNQRLARAAKEIEALWARG